MFTSRMPRKIVFVYDGKHIPANKLCTVLKAKNDQNVLPVAKKSKQMESIVQTENEELDAYFEPLNNKTLADLIKKQATINHDHIKNANLTAILRIASIKDLDEYRYPKLVDALHNHMKLRPLPIKLFTHNAITKEKTPINLFDHQIGAIEHIRKRERIADERPADSYGVRGSIIKLEMGLGKTLTAITSACISPKLPTSTKFGEKGFPTLVVASKTVLMMWRRDGFEKFFTSDVKVLYFHSTFMPAKAIDTITRKQIVQYDFVVTSYDMVCAAAKVNDSWKDVCEIGDEHTLMKDKIVAIHERTREQADNADTVGKLILFHTPWERIICDESQRFANPKTFTFKAMMNLYARYKLLLTGTPIRNYDTDIWAQLRFCGYTGIIRAIDWKRKANALMKLHNLNSVILSVDYKDTAITLPPKIYMDRHLTLEGTEKVVYEHVLGVTRNVYDMMLSSKANFACVLALFTRLRQICIAPYLMTAESKREKLKGAVKKADEIAKTHLNHLVEGPLWKWVKEKDGPGGIGSTKMQEIGNILKSIPKGKKVLLFSMYTSCLDLLAYKMEKETNGEYKLEQMDGDTSSSDRDSIIHKFNTDRSLQALLMTYKVGAEGLNLTVACYVICIEPWWTFAVPLQAEARAWRPGQKNEVIVYNIHCKGTIEDRVIEICNEKKEMVNTFLEGTEPIKKSAGLDKYTLGRILGFYK